SSQLEQEDNPTYNHVLRPDSGPAQLALTVHNTGQADLSVEINGLPCSTDINGSPIPTTVAVPAGGSSDAIVCEVELTCPAVANITVTVTGAVVPSGSVACALDSRGQPIRTAPSRLSASVAA